MSKNINKNQLLAAELLATGMKSKEVANKLSLSSETISRWKNNAEFNRAVDHFSKHILNELLDEQVYLYNLSFQCVKEFLENSNCDKFNRVNVALKYINSVNNLKYINRKLKDKIYDYEIL